MGSRASEHFSPGHEVAKYMVPHTECVSLNKNTFIMRASKATQTISTLILDVMPHRQVLRWPELLAQSIDITQAYFYCCKQINIHTNVILKLSEISSAICVSVLKFKIGY